MLAVIILRERRFLFTSINNAVISEETVLGIDSDRMDTTVFLVSADTGIGEYLRVPVIQDKYIVNISDPLICGDTLYFRKSSYDTEGNITEEIVCWNVKKGRLENASIPMFLWKMILAWEDMAVQRSEKSELLAEVDYPENSELNDSGKVRLCVLRNGNEKFIDNIQREPGKTTLRLILSFLLKVH